VKPKPFPNKAPGTPENQPEFSEFNGPGGPPFPFGLAESRRRPGSRQRRRFFFAASAARAGRRSEKRKRSVTSTSPHLLHFLHPLVAAAAIEIDILLPRGQAREDPAHARRARQKESLVAAEGLLEVRGHIHVPAERLEVMRKGDPRPLQGGDQLGFTF